MKNLLFLKHLMLYCLVIAGIGLPIITQGQIVNITGDIEVCVGESVPYIPDVVDPKLNYEWTVTPNPTGNGNLLSGNSTGSLIQWSVPGNATVNLVIRDPLNNNSIEYTGSLNVSIYPLPTPFITTDVILGCQPFNEDSVRDGYVEPPEFDSTNCQLVCAYSTVNYTANGSPGSTYTWTAYGAVSVTPATGPATDIYWGAPGAGEVVLTETTAQGCSTTTTICVEIIEKPRAKFIPQPDDGSETITICRFGQIVLIDQSTGSTASPLETWLWIWGDGHQSTTSAGSLNNPVTHQYDDPGDYEVMLVVTNSCGCKDTFTMRVHVMDPPAPKISCPRVVCEGETINYLIDQPCSDDSWEVIGGTVIGQDATNVTVRWDNVDPNTGFGYVMYHTCDPCPMVVTEEVPVVLRRGVIQGPAAICPDKQYVYRMPKWPTTDFTWTVVSGAATLTPTDQRNEIALEASGPGMIVLRVNYFNTVLKCEGSAEMHIEVLPQATISGDDLLCQDENRTYTLSGGLVGNWTLRNAVNTPVATGFGNSINHTFTLPGNYKLSVQGSTFCPPEDFLIKVVATPPPPDDILGPDRACAGIPLRYEGGSPLPGHTYQWSVSSGVTNSIIGDFSYITFAGAPNYTVALRRITTDGAGCMSDPIQKVVLPAVPTMTISGDDPACHSTEYVYSVDYLDGDIYEWSLPTTMGSVVQNGNSPQPSILFNVPGVTGQTVTISLKMIKCGMEHWVYKDVFVRGTNAITNVTLSEDTVCSNETFTLSVYTAENIVSGGSYSINWGDGNYSNGTMPGGASPYGFNYDYNTDGQTAPVTYTPVVTITDPNGCPGGLSFTAPPIVVLPRPIALVSPTGPILLCGTVNEVLTATETSGIGGSNSFTWSGPSFTGGGTSITATGFGGFNATVLNTNGCFSTGNTVQVIDTCNGAGPGNPGGNPPGCSNPPAVTLTPNTWDCGAISISTSMLGGIWTAPATGTITNVSVTGNTITATATAAGEYTFLYVMPYGTNCYQTYYINILVPYVAETRYGISCNQAGGNYHVMLFDHSTQYPANPITTRNYFTFPGLVPLGSGTTSIPFTQGAGLSLNYIEVISDGVNPPCTSFVNIVTPDFPTVDVSLYSGFDPGCVEDEVFQFAYTSTGNISSHWWDFGDVSYNASATVNPIGKVYSSTNLAWPISLTVTDEYGCTATDGLTVGVVNNPYAGSMSISGSPVCLGSPVTLTYVPSAGGFPGSYTWYDQSAPLFTTGSPNFNVYTPGAYWVEGVGLYGCRVSTNPPLIPVDVIQVPAVGISGQPNQCVGSAFTLLTQDYGADYEYSWNGGPYTPSSSFTTTLNTPGGPYPYTVTIRHIPTGCTYTSPAFNVSVSTPPVPPSLSFNILNCDPYELQLNASGAAGTYNWSNGMSGTSFTTPHGGPYQVTLTDIYGCRVQNSINTPRSLEEYMWIFPDGCFCQGAREPYIIGPIMWFNYWEWQRNGGNDGSGSLYVQDYYGPTPGNIYNLLLDNGTCQLTSKDMYYYTDTCEYGIGRPINATGLEGINSLDNRLQIAPNPAINRTVFSYSFVAGAAERSIDIVDVTGRRLRSFVIEGNSGILEMPLDGYAAGTYQVLMRRDGLVVQRGKLSVTK
jgi:hypothetical protein